MSKTNMKECIPVGWVCECEETFNDWIKFCDHAKTHGKMFNLKWSEIHS